MEDIYWFVIGIIAALLILGSVVLVFQKISLCKLMGWNENRCQAQKLPWEK